MITINSPRKVGCTVHYNIPVPVESSGVHKAHVFATEESRYPVPSFTHSHPSYVSKEDQEKENHEVEEFFREWFKESHLVQLIKLPILKRSVQCRE